MVIFQQYSNIFQKYFNIFKKCWFRQLFSVNILQNVATFFGNAGQHFLGFSPCLGEKGTAIA
jgi:hypothetical protein